MITKKDYIKKKKLDNKQVGTNSPKAVIIGLLIFYIVSEVVYKYTGQ